MNGPAIETSNTPPPNPLRVRAAVGLSVTIHMAIIVTAISVRPPAEFRHASVRPGAAAIELQASPSPTSDPASTRVEVVQDIPSSQTVPDGADDSFAVDDTPPEPNQDLRDRRRRHPNASVPSTTAAGTPPGPQTPTPPASRRGDRNASSAPLPEIRRPSRHPETRRMRVRPPRPESAVIASPPVATIRVPATSTPGAQQDTPQPLASNRPPNYPSEAIAERIEGTTTLRATVSPEGEVTKLEIDRSSGSAVLDRAAMSAVALWRFEPQTQSVRDRAPRRVLIPIRFRLEN